MEGLFKEDTNTSHHVNAEYSELKKFNQELNTYYKTLSKMSTAFLALGAVENILVCIVLFKASKVRTTQSGSKLSKFFILQLAITDLVFRAVHCFHRETAKRMEITSEQCKMTIFSVFTCAAVTFVLLSAIAIDRYVHILFPIRSLGIKTRKSFVMLLIWIYALTICSGFIGSATVYHKPFNFHRRRRLLPQARLLNLNSTSSLESRTHCMPGVSGSLERRAAFTVYFLFAFVVPLLCIIFSYTKITVFLWKKTKQTNIINRSMAKAKLRATQMFALVVFSFVLSWGPIMILDMIASYPFRPGKITFKEFPLRPLFDCFSQTSSILNPIIYAFGDTHFRRSLGLLLRVRKMAGVKINRVSPAKMNGTFIQMTNLNPRTQ